MQWSTASLGTSVGLLGAGVFALFVAAALAVVAAENSANGTPSIVAATGFSLFALGAVGIAVTVGVLLAPNSRDVVWEDVTA